MFPIFELFVGSRRAPCRVVFEKIDVLFLCKMVWMLSTGAAMTEMGMRSEGLKIWRDALDQARTKDPLVFMTS